MKNAAGLIMRRKGAAASFLAVFMIILLVFGLITQNASALSKVSDPDTTNSYVSNLGDDSSTRYAGRVWADKTVYTGNAEFSGDVGTVTVENDSDFLIGYSLLSTSQKVIGETSVPLDVVLVIDNSNSMDDPVSSTGDTTRTEATVDAVNATIESIMATHENSRVAVIAYDNVAAVLMPLDHYTGVTAGNVTEYIGFFSSRISQGYETVDGLRNSEGNCSYTVERGSGGTNIQAGVDLGMQQLIDAENIETDGVKHVPAVIIMSDGSPTYSSSGDWWDPETGTVGSGSDPYTGHSLKVSMNAQYNKQLIDRHYGLTNSNLKTQVYTVGIGIEQLSNYAESWGGYSYTGERDIAKMTLDPAGNINDGNESATAIRDAFSEYVTGGTPSLQVGFYSSYKFTHPASNDISTIAYNDGYFAAENADQVAQVFEDITQEIIASAPSAPTEVEGDDPLADGYVTYTDPIGEYLEVKDIKSLIYGGHEFKEKTSNTEGNKTTYTFEGTLSSDIYGEIDAANIIITVTEEDGRDIVEVKVPAAAIPLRINEITISEDGSISNVSNSAYPLRLLYTVGAKDGVDLDTFEGVSDEYISSHMSSDGEKVLFYANEYSGNTVGETTVGDAKIVFTPASTNPFFFVQEDTPIYTDKDCTEQATSIVTEGNYYFKFTYYHGNEQVTEVVERPAAEFGEGALEVQNGQVILKAGSPRLGNLSDFADIKRNNSTKTADGVFVAAYNEETGQFEYYLGNNGVMEADAPKSLTIAKKVTADEGLTAPDADFSFDLTIATEADGSANAILHKADGTTEQKTLDFDQDGKTSFTLKAEEYIEVLNVGAGVEYTVSETVIPEGFTPDKNIISGTVSQTDGDNIVTFTNNYSVTPLSHDGTDLDLSGTKTITGDRAFTAGDTFTFAIRASQVTPDAPLPSNPEVTINPDTGDSADFDFGNSVFTFDAPGQYRYVIEEQDPSGTEQALPGMTYDNTIYRLVVNVVDDGDGTLSIDPDGSDDAGLYKGVRNQTGDGWIWEKVENGNVNFTNIYNIASETIALNGKKTLTGKAMSTDPDQQFTFVIEAGGSRTAGTQEQFVTDSTQPMPENTQIKNLTTGQISFGAMTFGQDTTGKEYKYTIREVQPTEDGTYNGTALSGAVKNSENKWVYKGITYDNSVKEIIVKSTAGDNAQGEHAVILAASGDTDYIFANTYEASGEATLSGTKNITGRDFKEGDEFTFTVVPQGNAPEPEETSVTINPDSGSSADINFGAITFTEAGTYSYKITETAGTIGGITYDTDERTVTFTVTDNGDGTMEVVAGAENEAALSWTNEYNATFEDDQQVNVGGTKILNGKELTAQAFYFQVKALDGAPLEGADNGIKYVWNGGDGAISFLKNQSYTEAGNYVYEISERIPAAPQTGMTYDKAVYRVTVPVTDDLEGNLKTGEISIEKDADGTGIYEAAEKIEFTNTYSPLDVTIATLHMEKVLKGRELQDGEFEFTMTAEALNGSPEDGIILPQDKTVRNNADGEVIFGDITFSKVGQYRVIVTETVQDDPEHGITYTDTTAVTVFNVTDNNGQLVVTRSSTTGLTFVNTFTPDPVNVSLEGTKILQGRDWLDSDEFSFEIKAVSENAPEPGVTEVSVKKDTAGGAFNFGTLQFTEEGTYEYEISEVIPEEGTIPGITYDDEKVTVAVEVTKDNKTGELSSEVTYRKGSEEVNNAEFTNVYDAAPTDAVTGFAAQKKVIPTDGNSYDLEAGAFTFVLSPSDSNPDSDPIGEAIEKTNDENGSITFIDSAVYTAPGTYEYTVTEKGETAGGISYDDSIYKITVEVRDDTASGKLAASKVITKDGDPADTILFENGYDPAEATAVIGGTKILTGKDISDGMFEFELTGIDNAPMPAESKAVNVADKFQFGTITYDRVGEYKYQVREIKGSQTGMSYDSKVYEVAVSVTDNDGILEAEVTGADNIVFSNTYNPLPVSINNMISGEKTLTGRTIEAGEFEFDLVLNGEIIATARNDEDGKFVFDNIEITEAGLYNYTVVEKNNGLGGIMYDQSQYGVQVEVVDNNGQLEVKGDIGYSIGGEPADMIVFTNSYSTADAELEIGAVKKLKGRDLKAGEFTFELKDENGQVISRTTNEANGAILFDKLVFDTAGEYKYTVSEVWGDDDNIKYDETAYDVLIDVKDNGKGQLEATVKTAEGGIVFNNTYDAEQTFVKTGDNMPIAGLAGLMAIMLAAAAVLIARRKKAR